MSSPHFSTIHCLARASAASTSGNSPLESTDISPARSSVNTCTYLREAPRGAARRGEAGGREGWDNNQRSGGVSRERASRGAAVRGRDAATRVPHGL